MSTEWSVKEFYEYMELHTEDDAYSFQDYRSMTPCETAKDCIRNSMQAVRLPQRSWRM